VAFDVWRTVTRRGLREYLGRTSGLVLATLILVMITFPFYLRILGAQGQLTKLAGWRHFTRAYLTEVGLLRKMVRPWLAYFRPSFHPWDHDNREFLTQLDELVAPYQTASQAAA